MLKNKRGFTLVELLVAIATMISITVVAIISITKISEQNKKQAYELVKEQVKTAALEYFSSNEYWFEGLSDGAEANISVGKLINEGFLNSVVNPETGEKLPYCSRVKVVKKDGKYNLLYDETEVENCDENEYIVTVNPEPTPETLPEIELPPYVEPKIEVFIDGTIGDNSWYKTINHVYLKVTVDESVTSFSVTRNGTKIMENNELSGKTEFDFDDVDYFSSDGIYNRVTYTLTTLTESNEHTTSVEKTVKKDGTPPEIVFSNTQNCSIDTPATIETENECQYDIRIYDKTSKLASGSYLWLTKDPLFGFPIPFWAILSKTDYIDKNLYSDSTKVVLSDIANRYTAKDNAGNSITKRIYAKINDGDASSRKPQCSIISSGSSIIKNGTEWYTSDVNLELEIAGNATEYGLSTSRNSKNNKKTATQSSDTSGTTWYGYIKNENGSSTCEITIKKDTTAPMPTINLSSTSETSGDVTFTLAKKTDDLSGYNRLEYSFDNKVWHKYDDRAVNLLNTTGVKTVYAREIDNAENKSEVAEATGKCDKDQVEVKRSSGSCTFYLKFSNKNTLSGVTSGKYEYAVWNKVNTTDTDNKKEDDWRDYCGTAPPEGTNIYTVTGSKSNGIKLLSGSSNMYYCFAVRPYRSSEIQGINRWTVQYKHAHVESKCS